VPVPEMFRYWLQGGRITTGFLGGAQIDKFANLNTTVVGPMTSRPCGCRAAAARRRSPPIAAHLHHHEPVEAHLRREARLS
jgi:acyl CoA:acetate/3-ketoacid CoA transferase beta subunit